METAHLKQIRWMCFVITVGTVVIAFAALLDLSRNVPVSDRMQILEIREKLLEAQVEARINGLAGRVKALEDARADLKTRLEAQDKLNKTLVDWMVKNGTDSVNK